MKKDNRLKVVIFILVTVLVMSAFVIYSGNSMISDTYEYQDELFSEISETEITEEEIQAVLAQYSSSNVAVYTDDDGNEYVMYEDFGATEDDDCWQAVYDTHVYANTYGYNVTTNLEQINIYKSDKSTVIPIQTNTDWNGATIYIHDEELDEDFDGDLNGDGTDEVRQSEIFKISSSASTITITNTDILNNIELDTETTQVSELADYFDEKGYSYDKYLCLVYNSNVKQYMRYINDSTTTSQTAGTTKMDEFVINSDGTLENEIQWHFSAGEITKIVLYPILDESITVGNGDFVTIVPSPTEDNPDGYWWISNTSSLYLYRGIQCSRSNTVMSNITHTVEYYTDDGLEDASELLEGPYHGFIYIANASYVTLKDSTLYTHNSLDGSTKSSYDLVINYATDILIENVDSNDINTSTRWGITTSNYTRDITYIDCTLNRIDAHRGTHNLTIDGCTIGVRGITLVGSGDLKITNTTRTSGSYFVEMRTDYGSTWNGTICIENSTFKSSSIKSLVRYNVAYNEDEDYWNFGYDLYLPNISVDDLTIINTSSSTSSDIPIFYGRSITKIDGTLNYSSLSSSDGIGIYNISEYINVGSYEITNGTTSTGQELYLGQFYNKDSDADVIDLTEDDITLTLSEEDLTNEDVTVWVELADEIQELIDSGEYELKYSIDDEETWEVYDADTGIIVEENTDIEFKISDESSYTIMYSLDDKETWEAYDDSTIMTIEENTDIDLKISDLYSSGEAATVSVSNIDKTSPTAKVSYSTEEDTYEAVTVTITANEEIQELDGWTLSDDGTVLTKEYTENVTETITIYDIAGNETNVDIEITNILVASDDTDDDNNTLSDDSTNVVENTTTDGTTENTDTTTNTTENTNTNTISITTTNTTDDTESTETNTTTVNSTDTTTATTPIPQTGTGVIAIVGTILGLIGVTIVFYIKCYRYRDIK